MTDWERVSVAVRPEQKKFLDRRDESNSKVFRKFVDAWMKSGDPPDGRDFKVEKLEAEIEQEKKEIEERKERLEKKKEILQEAKKAAKGLRPEAEDAVADIVEQIEKGSTAHLNPGNAAISNSSQKVGIPEEDLIKRAIERAESTPLDGSYRAESLARDISGQYMGSVDPGWIEELAEHRAENLPESCIVDG